MQTSTSLANEMAAMSKFGGVKKIKVGDLQVEYFIPYTRTVWEFKKAGVVVDRRYTPKAAAKFWCELQNEAAR